MSETVRGLVVLPGNLLRLLGLLPRRPYRETVGPLLLFEIGQRFRTGVGLIILQLTFSVVTAGVLLHTSRAIRVARENGVASLLQQRKYDEVLFRDPGNPDAIYALAREEAKEPGGLERARDLLEDVAGSSPSHFPSQALRARLALLDGDVLRAENAARIAVALRPEDPEAHLILGQALVLLEQPEDAVFHLRAALSKDPDLLLPYLDLFEAYRAAARRLPAKAEIRPEQALLEGEERVRARIRDDGSDSWLARVHIRILAGHGEQRSEEVVARLQELVAERPDDMEVRLSTIYALLSVGERSLALTALSEAESDFRGDWRLSTARTLVANMSSDRGDALAAFDRQLREPGTVATTLPSTTRVAAAWISPPVGGLASLFMR